MTKLTSGQRQDRIHLLANRLRTLLDIAEAGRGTEVTYTEIADHLSERGITLSRARWSYMVNGHRLVVDPALLDALSEFFDAPHSYLRGEPGTPDVVTAKLDLVRAMRANKVKSFATRTLGDLSPEVLTAITQFLDQETSRTLEVKGADHERDTTD